MATSQTLPILFGAALLTLGVACQESGSNSAAPQEKAAAEQKPGAHNDHDAHKDMAAKPGPADAKGEMSVYFVYPQDGSTVPETFDVSFGVKGYTVTPAGEHIEDTTRGHHHIIVDGGPIPPGEVVPKDERHIHYGGGETHAAVTLPPGDHTLTMQLADGAHRSFGPKAAKTVKVKVVEGIGAGKVFFKAPKDGAKVKNPVKVSFGLEGLTVRPAGEDVLDKTTGHHHLIIDGTAPAVGVAVPADDTHIHYGKGQTETEVTLSPGKHTLTMQLADGAHLAYGPRLSQTITVEVVE